MERDVILLRVSFSNLELVRGRDEDTVFFFHLRMVQCRSPWVQLAKPDCRRPFFEECDKKHGCCSCCCCGLWVVGPFFPKMLPLKAVQLGLAVLCTSTVRLFLTPRHVCEQFLSSRQYWEYLTKTGKLPKPDA